MNCFTDICGDVFVLKVKGEINRQPDIQNILDSFSNALRSDYDSMALDISNVRFASVGICGAMVSLCKNSLQQNKRFAIILPSDSSINSILQLTGVNKIVDIYEKLDSFINEVQTVAAA